MSITIYKTESGFQWTPQYSTKRYTIQSDHIFPLRHRDHILQTLRRDGESIAFEFFIYDRVNKILFVEEGKAFDNLSKYLEEH